MNRLRIPKFTSYDEEAGFWDNLDTGDFMEDDGKWFRFDTPSKRAVLIAILPDIVEALAQRASSTRCFHRDSRKRHSRRKHQ